MDIFSGAPEGQMLFCSFSKGFGCDAVPGGEGVCVLGSRSGPGQSLSGTLWRDGARSVVLGRVRSQVAVGIVGRLVSETSPAGRSMPV